MNPNASTLASALQRTFLTHVVATPQGRAHLLNQVADAESNGESTIFEALATLVDDAELAKLVHRHAADEVEHARLFAERRDAQGYDVGPAPAHLRIIDRLDRKLGGRLRRGVQTRRDVMDAYTLLQVVEERACTQFPAFVAAFRPIDPETAEVFERVVKDEERHLRYCVAIARRYAPSEEIRTTTLAELRVLEAECFAEQSRDGLDWILDRGYTDLSPLGRAGFRALGRATRLRRHPPMTPFATPKAA